MSKLLDMTLRDDHIEALERADLNVREAKAIYENARALRDREIRRVAAEGGSYREISGVSGVAHQRVAQVVTGREPVYRETNDHLKFKCPKCGASAGKACEGMGLARAHEARHALALEDFIRRHPEQEGRA